MPPTWPLDRLKKARANRVKEKTLFQDSTIPTYKKLNAFMESTKPSVMTDGNKAGLDRVRR